MRNNIWLWLLLLALPAWATGPAGLVIEAFNTQIHLPPSCRLFARPVALANEVRFVCDLEGASVVHVYVQPRSACIAQIEAKERIIEDRKVIRGHERARTRSTKKHLHVHQWLVWDAETCIMAIGPKEAELKEILEPVWE